MTKHQEKLLWMAGAVVFSVGVWTLVIVALVEVWPW